MFVYEKKLQYPIKIENPNPQLASFIISQYGGPDGELGASIRYLSQRYSMPYPELKGLLTDIGVEELGHLEMVGTIVYQLTRKLSPDDPDARRKLYHHCCMFGTARDAVDLFEEIQGVPMADSSYRDAIARYLYLGEREKALQTAERLATSRLWAVAGPTQVRPMSFFEDPNLREFLLEPESLRRIREAAFIDDGSLIRK